MEQWPLIISGDNVKPRSLKEKDLGELYDCVINYIATPKAIDVKLKQQINQLLDTQSAAFDAAYVYDAVTLFAMAKQLELSKKLSFKQAMTALTGKGYPVHPEDFARLLSLYQQHKNLSYQGISGDILFDSKGNNVMASSELRAMTSTPAECKKVLNHD
jgi:hypothetical protein